MTDPTCDLSRRAQTAMKEIHAAWNLTILKFLVFCWRLFSSPSESVVGPVAILLFISELAR